MLKKTTMMVLWGVLLAICVQPAMASSRSVGMAVGNCKSLDAEAGFRNKATFIPFIYPTSNQTAKVYSEDQLNITLKEFRIKARSAADPLYDQFGYSCATMMTFACVYETYFDSGYADPSLRQDPTWPAFITPGFHELTQATDLPDAVGNYYMKHNQMLRGKLPLSQTMQSLGCYPGGANVVLDEANFPEGNYIQIVSDEFVKDRFPEHTKEIFKQVEDIKTEQPQNVDQSASTAEVFSIVADVLLTMLFMLIALGAAVATGAEAVVMIVFGLLFGTPNQGLENTPPMWTVVNQQRAQQRSVDYEGLTITYAQQQQGADFELRMIDSDKYLIEYRSHVPGHKKIRMVNRQSYEVQYYSVEGMKKQALDQVTGSLENWWSETRGAIEKAMKN